jgi:hypothetical protein
LPGVQTHPCSGSPEAGERFVDENFVAAMLSVSPGYLANLRSRGGGPKFSNLGKPGRGRCIRYRVADVLAWADSRAVASTSQYKTAG